MTSQCLKHDRFSTTELLRNKTAAWAKKVNKTQRGVNWQFNIEKSRHKLKSFTRNLNIDEAVAVLVEITS